MPGGIHSVAPYSRFQGLTADYERNCLYVVLEDQLYRVILHESDYRIERLPFDDYEFKNILFNPKSNRIYAIALKKIQNDEENKSVYSLVKLEDGNITPQYTSNAELDHIHIFPYANVICLSSIEYSNYPENKRELYFLKEK